MPVTVASTERSFNTMARVKNALKSTPGQECLAGFGVQVIESKVATLLNFSEIITVFEEKNL